MEGGEKSTRILLEMAAAAVPWGNFEPSKTTKLSLS